MENFLKGVAVCGLLLVRMWAIAVILALLLSGSWAGLL